MMYLGVSIFVDQHNDFMLKFNPYFPIGHADASDF